jgi:hypothetical protein
VSGSLRGLSLPRPGPQRQKQQIHAGHRVATGQHLQHQHHGAPPFQPNHYDFATGGCLCFIFVVTQTHPCVSHITEKLTPRASLSAAMKFSCCSLSIAVCRRATIFSASSAARNTNKFYPTSSTVFWQPTWLSSSQTRRNCRKLSTKTNLTGAILSTGRGSLFLCATHLYVKF